MRLIRSKIYRAFPELDRFSDDQGARFVAHAKASWRRCMVRWTLIGLAGLIGVGAAGFAFFHVTDALSRWLRLGDISEMLLWGVVGVAATSIPLVAALWLRDQLLRRTIRTLIRRCGNCPRCRYSLLGMRVGPDCKIVCPECGLGVDVDPAMGELSTDATGAPVYKPEVSREHALTARRRKRRHRLFIKWTAIGVTSILLLLGSAYGLWWWSLVRQAEVAKSERNTRQRLDELRATMWREGGPHKNAQAQWAAYLELVTGVADKCAYKGRPNPFTMDDGREVWFDFTVLARFTQKDDYEKRYGAGSFRPTVGLVLAVIRDARTDATTDSLRGLMQLPTPVRPLKWDDSQPFFSSFVVDGFSQSRAAARFNAARMCLALAQRNQDEYVEALEETLVIADICDRQGLLIDKLVGNAIRALALGRVADDQDEYPDAEWTRAVLEAIVRRDDRIHVSNALEMERIGVLDSVQHFFSSPAEVQKAQLGLTVGMTGTLPGRIGAIGSYAKNNKAVNDLFDACIAASHADPWNPGAPLPTNTGYPIVDVLTPAVGRIIASVQKDDYTVREAVFALSVRMHRWNTGEFPKTPEQLAPTLPDPKYAIDPISGKPFWFSVRQKKEADGFTRTVLDVINLEPADAGKGDGAAPTPTP